MRGFPGQKEHYPACRNIKHNIIYKQSALPENVETWFFSSVPNVIVYESPKIKSNMQSETCLASFNLFDLPDEWKMSG